MEAALYHPQHGYYRSRREKMGREGDYLTSPEVSPIFGVLLGRQLREMWQAMGEPRRFDVVEAGAGTGRLCRDILRWARTHAPDLRGALAYTIVEVSEALAERQRETLAEEGCDVRWCAELPDAIEGCLLSNELLDSFPVHRMSVSEGALLEVFVGWDGARFVEELRPPSAPELETYFSRLGLLPGEGCSAEVNLAALEWMQRAAGRCGPAFSSPWTTATRRLSCTPPGEETGRSSASTVTTPPPTPTPAWAARTSRATWTSRRCDGRERSPACARSGSSPRANS